MFDTIKEKVANNIRLSREEGIYLYTKCDFLDLAALARQRKISLTEDKVYFNVNCHINLSNVCISRCKFCAFGVDPDHPSAYLMSREEAFAYGSKYVDSGITEFHIVSAMHPDMPFEYYLEIVSDFYKHYPKIHIQAFTAVEIVHFAKIANKSVREILTELKTAGLGSIPGGGAEILNDNIRNQLCPKKATSAEWLEVHKIAHELNIKTNCTMLYGHVESIEDRIDHMITIRELQDIAPGFQSFIPLPFLPSNTGLTEIKRSSAVEDLRTIAVARLMLDNIEHIKAFWIMLTLPIAQIALDFGADDVDGTVIEEKIMHAADVETEKGISKSRMIDLIKEAGYKPCERDTLYNIVRTF